MDSDYGDIIDYYAALAAQHPGKCVFHAPKPEDLPQDEDADSDTSAK